MKLEAIYRIIDWGINSNKVISVITYTLRDTTEKILNHTLRGILKRFKREEIADIVYTCVKELVTNATKANLKRVLFEINGIDPRNPEEYERGVKILKQVIKEKRMKEFLKDMKEKGYNVVITFYFNQDVLNIKVKNRFVLYKFEDDRIREKFEHAKKFNNIMEFYLEHGDETEGAGLGIVLVNVLLKSINVDPRYHFAIFSNKYGETVAKLQIPLSDKFIPKRKIYEQLLKEGKITVDDIRDKNYSI